MVVAGPTTTLPVSDMDTTTQGMTSATTSGHEVTSGPGKYRWR